jgi:hypothetical protein
VLGSVVKVAVSVVTSKVMRVSCCCARVADSASVVSGERLSEASGAAESKAGVTDDECEKIKASGPITSEARGKSERVREMMTKRVRGKVNRRGKSEEREMCRQGRK